MLRVAWPPFWTMPSPVPMSWSRKSPNDGFVVRSPTRGVKPLFYSSGYATDPALRPKLTVQY